MNLNNSKPSSNLINYIYLVYAGEFKHDHKLNLTKSKYLEAMFVNKEDAKRFAKNYSIKDGKSKLKRLITAVLEIEIGSKPKLDEICFVYHKTSLDRVLNKSFEAITKEYYNDYVIVEDRDNYLHYCLKCCCQYSKCLFNRHR